MLLSTIYVSRYNSNLAPRLTIMIMIAIIVRTSEYINIYGSQHWQEFGISQNYFDPKGFFMTIMVCSPLLLFSFIMLFSFLREASTLLIQVKKVQLQKQHRQKHQKGNATTAKTSTSRASTVVKKDQ
jgi:TRAP-type C4-dicarboxylate transport system permease small subunit